MMEVLLEVLANTATLYVILVGLPALWLHWMLREEQKGGHRR